VGCVSILYPYLLPSLLILHDFLSASDTSEIFRFYFRVSCHYFPVMVQCSGLADYCKLLALKIFYILSSYLAPAVVAIFSESVPLLLNPEASPVGTDGARQLRKSRRAIHAPRYMSQRKTSHKSWRGRVTRGSNRMIAPIRLEFAIFPISSVCCARATAARP